MDRQRLPETNARHPTGRERSSEVDDQSIDSAESTTSSSARIDDELSVELKPYLEIGKQLNVSSRIMFPIWYLVKFYAVSTVVAVSFNDRALLMSVVFMFIKYVYIHHVFTW